MALKRFKPVTSGSRFRSVVDRSEITRSEPERSLTEGLRATGGRNHNGHMTMRRRGGGHKRTYRKIDFRREKHGIPGRITEIEYDPNRTANIALVTYADGEKRYILHPRGLGVGTRSSRARRRTSRWATRCRSPGSPWERQSTTWS